MERISKNFKYVWLELDSVGDGIPDSWKAQYFGFNWASDPNSRADADPDGDGVTNLQEYQDGTDPTNAASHFSTLSISGPGTVTVQPAGTRFSPGTVVTISALPDGRADFANWTGDLISDVNPLVLVMARNYQLVAHYTDQPIEQPAVPASFTDGTTSAVKGFAVQPDGKLIAGGDFDAVQGITHYKLVRINPGGTLDASFAPSFDQPVNVVSIQSDGKIMVGGAFQTVNGVTSLGLCRLNVDGSIDRSFTSGVNYPFVISSLAIDAQGKIIVGGNFFISPSASVPVARFNSDGSIDASFSQAFQGNSQVNSVLLQPDGKVLVSGNLTQQGSSTSQGVVRLEQDGTIDTTFSVTLDNNSVTEMALNSSGQIYIFGGFSVVDGRAASIFTRINANGTPDTSFQFPSNITFSGVFNGVFSVLSNGQVILVSTLHDSNTNSTRNVLRLNSDGSVDTTFGNNTQLNFFADTAALDASGRLFLGGAYQPVVGGTIQNMVRLSAADGSIDGTFLVTVSSASAVAGIAVQPDGASIAWGPFNIVNGAYRPYIARLHPDGSLDSSFNSGTGPSSFVNAAAIQPDGKVVVGGRFGSINGQPGSAVARFNADGSLDTGFSVPGLGFGDGAVEALAVQPDGKIVVAGGFTLISSITHNQIARLNPNGTVDDTFVANADVGPISVAVQSGGKILVAGTFAQIDGKSESGLARLNSDGSIDTSFNNPLPNQSRGASFVGLQPDGKILVGGAFLSIDVGGSGVLANNFARLNGDGTVDVPFTSAATNVISGGSVQSIVAQDDGRILLGGNFGVNFAGGYNVTNIQNGANNVPNIANVIRLNLDGTLDRRCVSVGAPNNTVSAVAVGANEAIVLGGQFTEVSSLPRLGYARLLTTTGIQTGSLTTTSPGPDAPLTLNLSPQSPNGPIANVVFESSGDSKYFQLLGYGAPQGNGVWSYQATALASGVYLRARAANIGLEQAYSNALGPLATPPAVTLGGKPAPSPSIAVNRMVPAVLPPSARVTFSGQPTDTEIEQARIFDERLVRIGTKSGPKENMALANVLSAYAEASLKAGPSARDTVDLEPIENFLLNYPNSSWKVALQTNLGIEYYRRCAFAEALDAWRQAWELGKNATDSLAPALVDRALAELARMEARLGLEQDLQNLFAEAGNRQLHGAASTIYAEAKGGLSEMKNHPEQAFKCGPWALSSILATLRSDLRSQLKLRQFQSTDRGTSLAQVAALSREVGLSTIIAHREGAATVPVPAVVHWKLGHFGALLKQEGDRYLLQDPTFGNSQWISQAVLARESTGYFLLVATDHMLPGWRSVSEEEAGTVWGKGYPSAYEKGGCSPKDSRRKNAARNPQPGECPPNPCNKNGYPAMADWDVHLSEVSLNIEDTPIGYTPPIGPQIYFNVNYDQYEDNQPATFSFSNLGNLWNCDWVCTLTFDSNNATVNYGSGGSETMTNFTSSSQSSSAGVLTHSTINRLPGNSGFQQSYPDGSQSIFGLADGSHRYYLTELIDPQGNAAKSTYDSQYRLVAITDSIGQVSTISYTNSLDPFKITQVTDPFGRTAQFFYNPNDQLAQITDTQGTTSQFTYGSGDFIQTLTTGYGSTNFSTSTGPNDQQRTIIVTNPDGSQEMAEGLAENDAIPASDPANTIPTGINTYNADLIYRNTFYWDRKAMLEAPGDFTKARIYQFLHGDALVKGRVIETMKMPLENRVWYFYQGQQLPYVLNNNGAEFANPTQIARVLDDGTTQLYQYQYNALGNLTQTIDPLGRITNFTLDPNGIDVVQISRVTGQNSADVLTTFKYNSQHLPLTITDAAGQTTVLVYNSAGQVLSITDPKQRTTTFTYNSSGYLVYAAGPLAGSTDHTTYTYDTVGRVQQITDALGFTRVFAYDNLDRVTSITYPDQSQEQFQYTLLDVSTYTDRLDRPTTFAYDSLDRLIQVTAGGFPLLFPSVRYEYCGCGAISSIIDQLGQTTYWDYDIEGRKIKKTYADGSNTSYNYEATASRLASSTDSKGQITAYQYNADDTIAQIAYENAVNPTPSVLFSYDVYYQRLTSMTDGTGETDYSYVPIVTSPALGAGRLAGVNSRFRRLSYGYDEMGQVVSRTIDGVTETVSYDNLNRISAIANALGTFSYTYVPDSRLISRINLPTGEITDLGYLGTTNDNRLSQIQHLHPTNDHFSNWTYNYDSQGDIIQWTQQYDNQPQNALTLSYDGVGQLQKVSETRGSYGYEYDDAGNGTIEDTPFVYRTASYNGLNELSSVITTGNPPLENDRTYEWDAANRLIAINYSGTNNQTQISYDGLGRWAQMVEKSGATITSTKNFVWDGLDLAEELDANGTLTKRFYAQGVQLAGSSPSNFFYFRDHEGSIREVTDTTGVIRARYDYDDPFGRITQFVGNVDFDFGFTGFYRHAASGLDFAVFRAYDPNIGRWISRDPVLDAELGNNGPHLYAYVLNDPVNLIDPSGLYGGGWWVGTLWEAGIGFGASVQGTMGGGLFSGGGCGLNGGSFMSGGGFVGNGESGLMAVESKNNQVYGISGGLGGGLFVTNAKDALGLGGAFDVLNVSVGFISVQYAWGGGIWDLSIGVAKSNGLSGSIYRTTTIPHESPETQSACRPTGILGPRQP